MANSGQLNANSTSWFKVNFIDSSQSTIKISHDSPQRRGAWKKKVSCLYVCSFKLLRYSCCSLVFLISAVWLQICAKLSSRQVFNLDRTVRHSRTFMSVPTGSKEHQEKTRWGNAELIKGRWRWRCSSAVINYPPSGPEGLASVPSTRQGGVDELL